MAKHLDLEEQEQLDQLKAFWNQYGNLISAALIVVFGTIAAYNGYNYWQRSQAVQASTLFDEVERSAKAGDATKTERAFNDMKDKFGSTTYAAQAGLLAARTLQEKGNTDGAKAALTWVSASAKDDSYQSIAKLRLAGLLMESKGYDAALAQLGGSFAKEFAPLVADRRGDIFMAQGKKPEAKAEYEKAYKTFDERSEYRRLVEVKLNSLGVDAAPLIASNKPAADAATSASTAPAAPVATSPAAPSVPAGATSTATSTALAPAVGVPGAAGAASAASAPAADKK
jgi:predicted negative regulator of RcsB-dependent stress response